MLAALRARGGRALTPSALLRDLRLERGALAALRKLLSELERDGRIQRLGRSVRVPREDGLESGVFEPAPSKAGGAGGSVAGEGGVVWKVGDSGGASAGDRVLVAPGERGRAEILHVLEGARAEWIGILQRRGRMAFVTPYRDAVDWAVRVGSRDLQDAREGEVVVVVPVEARGRSRGRGPAPLAESPGAPPWGRVVARLGRPGDPEADFRCVVWRHRLPRRFPTAAEAQVAGLPEALDPAEVGRRVDLRERRFFTIDPESARDFDDAICVEPAEGPGPVATRLWVAVADVSHYVPRASPVDDEAFLRGNSVYFPDRAIPMLPERLSGDLCSLRPERDRLALVVEVALDGTARVVRRSIYPAVIRSRARLVYERAAELMEGRDAAHPLAAELGRLARVAAALRRRRRRAGSLDFELPAAEVVLDEAGRPTDVRRAARNVSHRAVEDAMLLANRVVAETLVDAERVAVHRNHPAPAALAMESLRELLGGLDLLDSGGGGALGPLELSRALARAVGRPEERYVHEVALRSMRQARYGAESQGHFALAFERYTHFTSPIRRYADLVVHRAVKALLAGDPPRLSPERARRIAARTSFRERLAVEAEREMVEIKRCVVMAQRVGEVFEGTISGVASHGLYVTLDAPFVDGLVHVSTLPGYMVLDGRGHALVSQDGPERFALGDRMTVRVAAVDPIAARIGFEPEGSPPGRRGAPRRSGRSR